MNAVVKTVTTPVTKPRDFPGMLDAYGAEIARALPKHLSAARMNRAALTAYRMTPKLAQCDPRSIFAAVIQAAQLGLEVGIMGEAYLVPFKRDCQLIPGYQGLMKLARNTGLVKDIYAYEVRAKDEFEVVLGLERALRHEPLKEHGFLASDEKRGEIIGFYAVAVFKDGSRTFHAMSRAQVEGVRDNSPGYKAAKAYAKPSLWETDFLSMGLKTPIRRLCKFLPRSPELVTALLLDTVAEQGQSQQLTVEQAVSGDYVFVENKDTNGHETVSQNAQAGEAVAIPLRPESQTLIEQIQGAVSEQELQALSARVADVSGLDRVPVIEAWRGKELALCSADVKATTLPSASGR